MAFKAYFGEPCYLCQPNSGYHLFYSAFSDLHIPCPYCFANDFNRELANFEVGFNRAGEMMVRRPGSQTVKVYKHGSSMAFELAFQVVNSPVDLFKYTFFFNKGIKYSGSSAEELEKGHLAGTKITGQADATGTLLADSYTQGEVIIRAFVYDLTQ
jgi:hypothetical protein